MIYILFYNIIHTQYIAHYLVAFWSNTKSTPMRFEMLSTSLIRMYSFKTGFTEDFYK